MTRTGGDVGSPCAGPSPCRRPQPRGYPRGMFGGIVAGVGRVIEKSPAPGAAVRLGIDVRVLGRALAHGASVSVSGVCLTVVRTLPAKDGTTRRAWFDVIGETIRRTTLGDLAVGDAVNLEGALRIGDEIGGHLVEGHVGGVGEVVRVDVRGDETWMTIRAPADVHATLAPKGYVTVHGASLTVADLGTARGKRGGEFSVALIPTTLALTTLGEARRGTRVNIEGDPVGRHVARWLSARGLDARAESAAVAPRRARSRVRSR